MASRRESIFSNIISSLSSCCATSCSQALDYDLQFTMLNWNKRQSSLLSITLHQQSFFFSLIYAYETTSRYCHIYENDTRLDIIWKVFALSNRMMLNFTSIAKSYILVSGEIFVVFVWRIHIFFAYRLHRWVWALVDFSPQTFLLLLASMQLICIESP